MSAFLGLGVRYRSYARHSIQLLDLQPGDSILYLGCGNGEYFDTINSYIGSTGSITAIDQSQSMLDVAKNRAERDGITNIRFILSDFTSIETLPKCNKVLSLGNFGHIDDINGMLQKISDSLDADGVLVVMDLQKPENWPKPLFKFFLKLCSVYGVNEKYCLNNVTDSVKKYFAGQKYEERYFGSVGINVAYKKKPL